MGVRLKVGDEVVVIAGGDKGVRGKVLKVFVERDRVLVEGVNLIKRHQSPQRFREGGIITREAPVHISNVMLYDSKADARARLRAGKDGDGKKVRVSAKSGAVLDG